MEAMSLFQKKPITESVMPLYTLSSNKTLLIVGLGNIGAEYDQTRHNVGFMCLDAFAESNDFSAWVNKKDLKAQITQATLGDTRVILAKPTTFMNNSGEAVQAIANFYKIAVEHIIVVHDELDVDFGQIRCRVGGGAAGNNGIKSLIQHGFGDTGRVRVGIGPKTHPAMDSADFVLQKFSAEQSEQLKSLSREVTAILTETIYGDGQLPHDTRSF
jgi:PTH1 family peptidyl-tRNA hydrolase